MFRPLNRVMALISVCFLGACVFMAKPREVIPVQTVSPHTVPARLVIVLPGYGDTLATLKKSGIADVIQRSLPDAEVALVEFSIPYYMEGRATKRLHDEIVAPAARRGIREIYLAGASMGGMGVLMYEHDYPNAMRGLILMAPYMGDIAVMKEIEAAGGLAKWDAGLAPPQLTRENVPREEWRVAQSWNNSPRARDVWLICGQADRFHPAAEMLAAALPPQHYFSPEGGHKWKVWIEGATHAFEQIAASGRAENSEGRVTK